MSIPSLPRSRALASVLLLTLLVAPVLAAAPPPAAAAQGSGGPGDTTMRGQTGLDPVEERRLRFLFWAYTAIWILLAAYLVSISIRLRRVRRELARMKERLGRPGGG